MSFLKKILLYFIVDSFSGNGTEKAILTDDYRVKCEIPCSSRYTCENCTQGPCMWCSSQQMCIESNAYAAIFPVAQCMEWTTQMTKCRGYKAIILFLWYKLISVNIKVKFHNCFLSFSKLPIDRA